LRRSVGDASSHDFESTQYIFPFCHALPVNQYRGVIDRLAVIRSFRDRETERLYRDRSSVRFQAIAKVALRKLDALDATTNLWRDLALPGNHLEQLIGNRSGQHSVRINDQWRVCFCWIDGNAEEVEIVDYH
jgi:toxin HigB-1